MAVLAQKFNLKENGSLNIKYREVFHILQLAKILTSVEKHAISSTC